MCSHRGYLAATLVSHGINVVIKRLNVLCSDELFGSNRLWDIWKNLHRLAACVHSGEVSQICDAKAQNEGFIFWV